MSKQMRSAESTWEPVHSAFAKWLAGRERLLEPGMAPKPELEVFAFLALEESDKPLTYEELVGAFQTHGVVKGEVPESSLRGAMKRLRESLDDAGHRLELVKPSRGSFKLKKRGAVKRMPRDSQDRVVLLVDSPAVKAEDIAKTLVLEGRLPFQALYFLEWSARWWEVYSGDEAVIRVPYEAGALEKLGIEERLLACIEVGDSDDAVLSLVGLAPGEGFGEIEILKRLLKSDEKGTEGGASATKPKIHYMAVDSSPRLLRDHIGLLRETFAMELENGDLLCAGVVADLFTGLIEAVNDVRGEFSSRGVLPGGSEFLPAGSPMLVTYLGNCIGNDEHDRESRLFSTVYSSLPNRPLELVVGVSVMRDVPDEYKRTWDDFLLLTPHHLLETMDLLHSTRPPGSKEPPEFTLPKECEEFERIKDDRCPQVVPEPYLVSYKIEGQRYRFDYRLAFELAYDGEGASKRLHKPKGSLFTLYNIIKYKMPTLVEGIKKGRLFHEVAYDPAYHQLVETPNGVREYAVFSAYLAAQEGSG